MTIDAAANMPPIEDALRAASRPPGSPPTPAAAAPGASPEPATAPARGPTRPAEQPLPRPEPKPAVRANLARGEDPEARITLSEEQRKVINTILTARVNDAQERRSKLQKPDPFDEVILRPEVISRIKSGEFNAEDLVTAWLGVDAELRLKMLAVAAIVANDPAKFDQIRNTPLVGRLVSDPAALTADELDALKALYDNQDFRELIKDVGYGEMDGKWDGSRVFKDLSSTHGTRTRLEEALLIGGKEVPKRRFSLRRHSEPIIESIYDPFIQRTPVRDFLDQSGPYVYRELAKQTEAEIKHRIDTDDPAIFPAGSTYESILRRYPLKALEISQEAAGKALSLRAGVAAREIAEGKRYDPSASVIRDKAAKLKAPADPEEIAPLKATKEAVDLELTQAKEALGQLRGALPQAEEVVETAEEAKNIADSEYKGKGESYGGEHGEIQRLKSLVTNLYIKRDAIPDSPIPKGGVDPRASTDSLIGKYEDLIAGYERELDTARTAQIRTAQALITVQRRLDELRGTAVTGTDGTVTYTGGRLKAANDAVEAAKTKVKNAQDELDKKVAPDRAKRADALDEWAVIAEGRGRLDEVLTSPKFGDEYPIEKLTDTTIRLDGQVEGAERFRALIGQTINKAGFNPDQYRLMMNDEAFALGMVESFRLNGAQITLPAVLGGGTKTFRGVIELLRITREELRKENMKKAPDVALIKRGENEIEVQERNLILHAIDHPRLKNATQTEIDDFVNFMVDQGLRSAELGEPYLSMIR